MSEETPTDSSPGQVSLKALNRRLKSIVEAETIGKLIEVWGESDDVFYTPNGHVRFKLHQGNFRLSCIVFRSLARELPFRITEGQTLQVQGEIQVYERWGELEINARQVALTRDVAAEEKLETLKARAKMFGWLDPARKRPVPRPVKLLGLVAGEKSRAREDVCGGLKDAGLYAEVCLEPVLMQGPEVTRNTISALQALNARPDVELIVIARGGGSAAELTAFNDWDLARAIIGSRVPVVTAIGHRRDTTLADLVADLSVLTPSLVGAALAKRPPTPSEAPSAPPPTAEPAPTAWLGLRRESVLILAATVVIILLLVAARIAGWL